MQLRFGEYIERRFRIYIADLDAENGSNILRLSTTVVVWDEVGMNYTGVSDIVVPIWQVQYWSTFTQRLEWQPIMVALGVSAGCDLVLFELVDRFVESGLLKEVLAGKVAYAVDG